MSVAWKSTDLQPLIVKCEKKLDDAAEKERTKLYVHSDAADVELQQQLSIQRRRLQEEAGAPRNESIVAFRRLIFKEVDDNT